MTEPLMLDTNVVIYSLGGNTAVTNLINNKEHFFSEITEIELLGFHGFKYPGRKSAEFLFITNPHHRYECFCKKTSHRYQAQVQDENY